MTFYKYYRSKEEVVESYLQEIISGYIENNHGKFSDNFPSFENTLAALNYFDSYADFFLVLDRAVVSLFALTANQRNLGSHFSAPPICYLPLS